MRPGLRAIPGDEYTIGGDPEGYAVERPTQKARLADFELAVHPVTNAEFAFFRQAGGYHVDAYWPSRALEWRNGQIGQEATQQQIRVGRQGVVDALGPEATAEAIRDHFTLSLGRAKRKNSLMHTFTPAVLAFIHNGDGTVQQRFRFR